MKRKFVFYLLILLSSFFVSCSFDLPTVTLPSWKGFNYEVKVPSPNGKPGDSIVIERYDIKPGDAIRVTAVRKNKGTVLRITGNIYLRCVIIEESGIPHEFNLVEPVKSIANSSLDGWEDPYATFKLPTIDKPYRSIRVEVSCQLYFESRYNQNSEVDFADMSSHEDPYLGSIYTDYFSFDPMNGGSASCNPSGGSGLKYHVIYPN